MAEVSRRGPLARGRSWPVTTADLRDALGDSFEAVSLVWHDSSTSEDEVVWVHWKVEASRRPGSFAADENSASIWLVPIGTEATDEVGALLRGQVLPEVAEWVRDALDEAEAWQALNHSKYWSLRDGELTTRTHDQSAKRIRQSR